MKLKRIWFTARWDISNKAGTPFGPPQQDHICNRVRGVEVDAGDVHAYICLCYCCCVVCAIAYEEHDSVLLHGLIGLMGIELQLVHVHLLLSWRLSGRAVSQWNLKFRSNRSDSISIVTAYDYGR